jgi:transcriptional regulator with XRE-family HTH domain
MALAKPRRMPRHVNKSKRPTTLAAPEIKIGIRLKHARLVRNLRLRELAGMLGCSESFLSKVENDKVRPSLAMLRRMVDALKINIAVLFEESTADSVGPVQIGRCGQRPIIRTDPLARSAGISLERLVSATKSRLIEANIHRVEPQGHTDGTYRHEGEEIGFVLEGRLELKVDGVSYLLEQGDSFFFRSDLEHGYRNPGNTVVQVLWFNTPPTF